MIFGDINVQGRKTLRDDKMCEMCILEPRTLLVPSDLGVTHSIVSGRRPREKSILLIAL